MPKMPSVNVSEQKTVVPNTQEIEVKGQNNPFTEDQFYDAWAGLSSLFPKEQRLLAMLVDFRPRLMSQELCVMTLANPWQKDEIKRFAPAIMDYIRSVLKNDRLKMQVVVSEQDTSHRAYTDEDKYKLLVGKNPAVKSMTETFHLILE